jgi:2Fe-2S ferredoxin
MKINVVDHKGAHHELEAPEGYRVMEVIRDYDVGIKAECGGACACATCHVYVDKEWFDKIPEPTDEEIDMLDEAFGVEDNSRLSCQILTDDSIDGITVYLAPGTEPEEKTGDRAA